MYTGLVVPSGKIHAMETTFPKLSVLVIVTEKSITGVKASMDPVPPATAASDATLASKAVVGC